MILKLSTLQKKYLCGNQFLASIGQDYKTKRVILNGEERAIIQIGDIANDKCLKYAIIENYAKDANGFIIMYNRALRESFDIEKIG